VPKLDLEAAKDATIPDILPAPGGPFRVLFVGINPGLYSAATGWHFARPGNRFWPALYASGFTPRQLKPSEQEELTGYGLGITNIAPRATAQAAPLSESARTLEQRLREGGFEPPIDAELDPDDLAALRAAGRAVRVSKTLHYHPDALAEVRRRVIELAERLGGSVTLAQVRDDLGTSRKFAQALLEHLDAAKVTIRRGDEHVVRRGHLGGG